MIIEGFITNIIYNKPNYLIFKLNQKIKVKHTDTISINLENKPYVKIEGDFEENDNYGRTFISNDIKEIEAPKTDKNLLNILINGIGEKKAEEIKNNLGNSYLDILEKEPIKIYDFFITSKSNIIINQLKVLIDSLKDKPDSELPKFLSKNITGLSTKKATEWINSSEDKKSIFNIEKIYQYWASNTANNIYNQVKSLPLLLDIINELTNLGFSKYIISILLPKYGVNTLTELKNNPYLPTSMGMDFEDCDELAISKFGLDSMSIHRVINGLVHILKENEQEGNTFMNLNVAIDKTSKLLNINDLKYIRDIINMNLGYEEPDFILKDEKLYRRIIFFTERKISLMIKEKLKQPQNYIPDDVLSFIKSSSLAKEQQNSVIGLIKNNLAILTGGPGTGKTTCLKILCKALKLMNKKFLLCAPTGRASKRMKESTEENAQTIHRLLEYKPMGLMGKFLKNEEYQLNTDYVILDESSMIDVFLVNSLLKAIKPTTTLIFVGDTDQLPSISMGSILRDLKESEVIPVFELNQIHRQGEESYIIKNSHNIKRNLAMELKKGSDFSFLKINNKEEMVNILKECINRHKTFQILCPIKNGVFGTEDVNTFMQINLNKSSTKSIYAYNKVFKVGDKVIQKDNDYNKEVYNGETGEIIDIENDITKVFFKDNDPQIIMYTKKELKKLDLAYAITIHKSQGSEFDNVIMIVDGHKDFLSKELLYTGITRAKKGLLILSLFDLDFYLNLISSNNRATNLKELLSA